MPDAARLTAALVLGIVGFVVSGMIVPLLEEQAESEVYVGYFFWINAGLGALVGWTIIGSRAGRGLVSAINMGVTGAFMLIFWGLFVQACNEMVRLAMRNRFDNAFESLIAIFEIGADWFFLMATVPVLGSLAFGGILAGLLAEGASRTWR